MKFGGTSVGSAERIRSLAERVRERLSQGPVVVVSALSGVTDLLVRGARQAQNRDAAPHEIVSLLLERHREVVHALFPSGPVRDRLLTHIGVVLGELKTIYTGVQYLGELTPRSLDAISGMGERMSCEIVSAVLEASGIPSRAVDARGLIVTDETFGRAQPIMDETAVRVRELLKPMILAASVPVVPGFIGSTRNGVSTTLGRGGSDWSASVIGALLPAEEIQIWTDVDGMMTVDPRLVPAARVISEVSYEEAAELAYFGAKVLHPATIKPAVERGIPVRILNSMNPTAPGTVVAEGHEGMLGEPRAIASKKGISVVLVSQPRMLMSHGFMARVFEVFERHHTSVDLIATSEVSISLTVDDPDRLPLIQADMAQLGEVRILRSMAIVSVVGRGFVRQAGLAARVFHALRQVNVVMISFGASDVNLSFVVTEADAERAVKSLHAEFFEGQS
jgi:aspartate kinase